MEIYESTPKIGECKCNESKFVTVELPKHMSKILSNMKKEGEDEKGQIRASIFISSESAKMVKHGKIQNKDLAIEVCA